MLLKLRLDHLKQIKAHCIISYPHECCGLLLGKMANEGKILMEVIPTENDWKNQQGLFTHITMRKSIKSRSQTDSYSISPRQLIKTQKQAREKNIDIIGIYHSHPNHPAIPSDFDQAVAWQTYSYIIVSVGQKKLGWQN